jgi:hypothetical protein
MDGAGSWRWLRAAASNAANSASGIGIRANAQIVLAGIYRDSITFGSKKLWAQGGLDVYLATIDGSTATVREDQPSQMIYPNPADRELHMTGAADQVQLQDLLGRTFTLRSENGRVDVSNLSAGVYHVGGTQVLIVHLGRYHSRLKKNDTGTPSKP